MSMENLDAYFSIFNIRIRYMPNSVIIDIFFFKFAVSVENWDVFFQFINMIYLGLRENMT